jgi:hypothetical protein
MPTSAANTHCGEINMTSDTGAIRLLYLAMLIIATGFIFLGYLGS